MGNWNSHGLRGSYLEETISAVNRIYFDQGLAVVQKVPTPITPVEYDKGKGTIKLAYFEKKSTVDFIGNIQGIPVCFDAKETGTTNLPLYNIHEHQVQFMKAFTEQDGLAFLIVLFRNEDASFLLPCEILFHYWDQAREGGRKSIPRCAFEDQYRIPSQGNIRMHYLESVSVYLSNRDQARNETAGSH
ncbi:MAG: Holliday junction resolvase RecU [Eubacteriaceae bacterium]|jgi:recombination protein U